MRRLIPRLLVLLLLLILAGLAAGLWLWQDMQRQLHQPMPMTETERLEVRPGTGLRLLAAEMTHRGWIAHPYYLLFHGRQEDISTRLQAGEYAVEPGLTPLHLLDRIIGGRVIQYNLTVIEGWSVHELLQAVSNHPVLVPTLPADLEQQPEKLARQLELPEQYPEGLFFPDTYRFPAGTTDVAFLYRSYHMLHRVLAEEWQQRAEDLPYDDPYEALIMASLIEKETGAPHERGEIAGVFVRRLEKGMRLQTDPTVIYGLGREFEGPLLRAHLQVESPYNTYLIDGLPPTPIALPGRAAIRAALQPEPGDTLYFVSRGDGTHYFSRTLEEHNRAVAKYIRGRSDIELENE